MKLCVTCDITLFDGATSCGVCGNNDLKSLTKPKIEEPQVEEPEYDHDKNCLKCGINVYDCICYKNKGDPDAPMKQVDSVERVEQMERARQRQAQANALKSQDVARYVARQLALNKVVRRTPRNVVPSIKQPQQTHCIMCNRRITIGSRCQICRLEQASSLGGGIKSNGGENLCKANDCTMKTVRGSYCPFHHSQYREKYRQRQDKLHKSRNGDTT